MNCKTRVILKEDLLGWNHFGLYMENRKYAEINISVIHCKITVAIINKSIQYVILYSRKGS